MDEYGRWCTSDDEKERVAKRYCHRLFTTTNPNQMDNVLNNMHRVVTPNMIHALLQPYTPDEVKRALFQMHPSKSLSLDNISPFFFQKYGNIVGDDVIEALLLVLSLGHLLQKMNYIHIVLIPKINEPQSVANYRPISLANLISKIVSKVVANWLKLILPNVIFDSQSAFVPNRLITNNIAVVFEVLHRMRNKRTGKKGQMTIKLDISKTYDPIGWSFLRSIMLRLGIDDQWIRLAMETMCTASYFVLMNGEPRGYITPSRGIK